MALALAAIFIFVCWAVISGANSDAAHRAANQRTSAIIPDLLAEMLKEEMPKLASEFTVARGRAAITWLDSWESRRLFAPYYPSFGTPEKKAELRRQASDLFAQRVAPMFGEGVAAYALGEPVAFHNAYVRCFEAAAAKARAAG